MQPGKEELESTEEDCDRDCSFNLRELTFRGGSFSEAEADFDELRRGPRVVGWRGHIPFEGQEEEQGWGQVQTMWVEKGFTSSGFDTSGFLVLFPSEVLILLTFEFISNFTTADFFFTNPWSDFKGMGFILVNRGCATSESRPESTVALNSPLVNSSSLTSFEVL